MWEKVDQVFEDWAKTKKFCIATTFETKEGRGDEHEKSIHCAQQLGLRNWWSSFNANMDVVWRRISGHFFQWRIYRFGNLILALASALNIVLNIALNIALNITIVHWFNPSQENEDDNNDEEGDKAKEEDAVGMHAPELPPTFAAGGIQVDLPEISGTR